MPEFSQDLFDEICEQIADGKSLRAICRQDDMPATSSVMRWIANSEKLQEQYARATDLRAENMFEDILDIADDGANDWMEREGGEQVLNGEHVQRSRLRIDARKWVLSRMKPKKYGDKLDIDHGGNLNITLPQGTQNL